MRDFVYIVLIALATIVFALIVIAACTFHAPFSHLTVIRTPISDVKSGTAHD